MPIRNIPIISGQYYHIYNRGALKADIFFSEANYYYCLDLFRKNAEKYKVSIAAYCLMPNHYHLLLKQLECGSISKMMGSTFNPYAQAVNIEQNRSGTLFEGRFKHIHIDSQEYILHLCRYIHLNPVEAGLVPRPEMWGYSDCWKWISGNSNADFIPEKFNYAQFLNNSDHDFSNNNPDICID